MADQNHDVWDHAGVTGVPAAEAFTEAAHASEDHTGIPGAGIESGTSFPGSPTADDLFYRTDRNLIYFYDGTRWLTVNEYDLGIGLAVTAGDITATGSAVRYPVRQDFGMYLVRWPVVTDVVTTNDGSKFWTVELSRRATDNTANNIASFSTGTTPDAPSTWVNHDQAINAVLNSSARQIQVVCTKTSTAGNLLVAGSLIYRLIG